MDITEIILLILTITYGVIIGSFLNVCIYRIPEKESVVVVRSHCMSCGKQLKWYDLVPLVSFLVLRGKCRYCKAKLSWQYPAVEALNGILYGIIVIANGFNAVSVLYCLATSALLALAVIDWRTYEIPPSFNIFIGILGIIRLALDFTHWQDYIIGCVSVSGFLLAILLITKGRGMGGGDVKLMAAAGLLLGWKLIILSLGLGCVLGSVIHIVLMRVQNKDRMLAFGPYLSLGIYIDGMWQSNNRLVFTYVYVMAKLD